MTKEAPKRVDVVGQQIIIPRRSTNQFIAKMQFVWGDQGTPGVDVALEPIVFAPQTYLPDGVTHD